MASALAFRWACFFTLPTNYLLNIFGGLNPNPPPLKYGPGFWIECELVKSLERSEIDRWNTTNSSCLTKKSRLVLQPSASEIAERFRQSVNTLSSQILLTSIPTTSPRTSLACFAFFTGKNIQSPFFSHQQPSWAPYIISALTLSSCHSPHNAQ